MMDEEKKTYRLVIPSTALTVRVPARGTRAQDDRNVLGTPPLKMVLVHLQDDHLNAAAAPAPRSLKTKEATAEGEAAVRLIVRLIEHLNQEP